MKIVSKLQMFLPFGGQVITTDEMSRTGCFVNGKNIESLEGFHIPTFKIGDKFKLTIPSGEFVGEVVFVRKHTTTLRGDHPWYLKRKIFKSDRPDSVLWKSPPEHGQVLQIQGVWRGTYYGAEGGLSALGGFSLIDIESVEGTFGHAKNMPEYVRRKSVFRERFYQIKEGESHLRERVDFSREGKILFERFLSTLQVDVCATVEHGTFSYSVPQFVVTENNLTAMVRALVGQTADLTDFFGKPVAVFVKGLYGSLDVRHFLNWIDLQFPVYTKRLYRQEQRYRLNPTERNLRRLERYRQVLA